MPIVWLPSGKRGRNGSGASLRATNFTDRHGGKKPGHLYHYWASLGGLGLHDFYAGYNGRGAVKLGIMFIPLMLDAMTGFRTGFSFIALVINGFWALVDVIFTKEDKAGNAMS
jgi:TM2 domain-containing membrane protein YozV